MKNLFKLGLVVCILMLVLSACELLPDPALNITDMSRELLAAEIKEILPVLLVAAVLLASLFLGYCIGRVQMSKKYSKKNMPEISRKHINYLALKLRTVEQDRNKFSEDNRILVSRLRGVVSLVNLPTHSNFGSDYWTFTDEEVKDAIPGPKLFDLDLILDKSLPKDMAVIKNIKKEKAK